MTFYYNGGDYRAYHLLNDMLMFQEYFLGELKPAEESALTLREVFELDFNNRMVTVEYFNMFKSKAIRRLIKAC